MNSEALIYVGFRVKIISFGGSMKKVILGFALLFFASSSFASTWTCYRYVGGHPTGTWIKVQASSKAEAENKGYAKMKNIGGRIDYAKCK